ncbi:ELMO domain-containing protein 3-like [Cephus cinctus]|uniref:ELMO domain-containing protein 3-like n=1 Tax=Cephus cinctus TaxID=211228 RepID=A0AAJ7W1K2_CEPCN|nr:ELMO domain-containing protein 3-like [Cephus cinctus]
MMLLEDAEFPLCSYDSNDCKHFSMLRTVYRSLVQEENVDFDWEKIGFQSNSPGTDLRGVGMLGILQMLYLCLNCSVLMEFLYVTSIDKYNTFPFAAVGLNMTRITLSVLRYEKLNKEINKNGVFEAANKFYASIFYAFGKLWVSKKKTISDVGAMFQDIEKISARRSNRRKMARELKVFLREKCFRDK